MKDRCFAASLILLVLLTSGILFKANSQERKIFSNFKVAVRVQCPENHHVENLMESYIKQELRSFKDVDIVGSNANPPMWQKLIDIHAMEIKDSSGMNTRSFAICSKFYNRIDATLFFDFIRDIYEKFPAVHLPKGSIAHYGINKLEFFCKAVVTDFDSSELQYHRDSRRGNLQQR